MAEDYPTRLELDYPESPSRVQSLLGVLLIKWVLLIPHLVILIVLHAANEIVIYVGHWAVLITGSYPRGLFGFVVGVQRWSYRARAWNAGVADRYPPFSLEVSQTWGTSLPGFPRASQRPTRKEPDDAADRQGATPMPQAPLFP